MSDKVKVTIVADDEKQDHVAIIQGSRGGEVRLRINPYDGSMYVTGQLSGVIHLSCDQAMEVAAMLRGEPRPGEYVDAPRAGEPAEGREGE